LHSVSYLPALCVFVFFLCCVVCDAASASAAAAVAVSVFLRPVMSRLR
jgi:hypothetical protein